MLMDFYGKLNGITVKEKIYVELVTTGKKKNMILILKSHIIVLMLISS